MSLVFHNWGRWVAQCDSAVCASAGQVERGQTSMVCQCRDTQICQHGGESIRSDPICGTVNELQWPDDLEAIEEVLSVRRLENRHWYPHETVADLEAENLAHGV